MTTTTKETQAVARTEATASEKFTSMVLREAQGLSGGLELTEYQRRLAQHMFIKIDSVLKQLETKRLEGKGGGDKAPFTWQNVNLPKLALDVVHRVQLGLDALIPNHVHPIPYFNSREKKYDLDLRVGYQGKDYYRRQVCLEEPLDIIYELVYTTDKFKPIKKSLKNEIESFEFEITSPFDRGEVVGGFGYIMYEDPRMNKLILVTKRDFNRSEAAAKTSDFWKNNPIEMRYKTVVHRVTDRLVVDPAKVNESFAAVEEADEAEFHREVELNANKEVIDFETGEIHDAPAQPNPEPEPGPETEDEMEGPPF